MDRPPKIGTVLGKYGRLVTLVLRSVQHSLFTPHVCTPLFYNKEFIVMLQFFLSGGSTNLEFLS